LVATRGARPQPHSRAGWPPPPYKKVWLKVPWTDKKVYDYNMSKNKILSANARTLLVVAALCAFFSIFSTFDTSEQYRAWRTAKTWTDEQKAMAPANDADPMATNALISLLLNTGVIVASFVCLLLLAIAVATENARVEEGAVFSAYSALALGVLYSVSTILYQIRVGPRLLLKGPIFDYNLHMQIPVILAVAGYPLLTIFFLLERKKISETDE